MKRHEDCVDNCQFKEHKGYATCAIAGRCEFLAGSNDKRELRPEVSAFAQAMEQQLRKNDWKGHWRHCTGTYLFNRLRGEVNELSRADGAVDRLKEAADVANFAMMIADNAKRKAQP